MPLASDTITIDSSKTVAVIPRRRVRMTLAVLTITAATAVGADDPEAGVFSLTAPIACKEIKGYEEFLALADPALTKDEKLLIYFRPRHFKTTRKGNAFEVHLSQDGRIRKKGDKAVLWSKKNILDYKAVSDLPRPQVYLKNMIALKMLKPGDYVFEIVLRDEIGKSTSAVGSLSFRVVAAPEESGATKQGEPGKAGSP